MAWLNIGLHQLGKIYSTKMAEIKIYNDSSSNWRIEDLIPLLNNPCVDLSSQEFSKLVQNGWLEDVDPHIKNRVFESPDWDGVTASEPHFVTYPAKKLMDWIYKNS